MSARHDLLHDLTPTMRAALADAASSLMVWTARGWTPMARPARTHALATLEALQRRTLLTFHQDGIVLTRKGRVCAAEITRRARVHRKLFGDAA